MIMKIRDKIKNLDFILIYNESIDWLIYIIWSINLYNLHDVYK